MRGSSLRLPRVGVGVEDASSEDVEDFEKVVALRVVVKLDVEDVVDVGGVNGGDHVHAGEPWT